MTETQGPRECSSGYCGWSPEGDPHTCPPLEGLHVAPVDRPGWSAAHGIRPRPSSLAEGFRADFHVSRSWPDAGTPLEDECPCPQEPCGHIARSRIDPTCEQHGTGMKTLRSTHAPEDCPAHSVASEGQR